ncbi:TPA: hypothetical protein ACPZF0_004398, partial [Yersinia enterocolitica]
SALLHHLRLTRQQDRPSETGDHLHREKLSIPCRGELVFQEFFSGDDISPTINSAPVLVTITAWCGWTFSASH